MAIPVKTRADETLFASSSGLDSDPHVAALPTGGFWIGDTAATAGQANDLQFYEMDSSGRTLAAIFFGVSINNASNQSQVSLHSLGDGNLVMTWTDDSAGNNEIRATIFNPNSSFLQLPTFLVNVGDQAGSQTQPEVTGLANGDIAFVWTDASTNHLMSAVFASFGTAGTTNITVNTSGTIVPGVDHGLTALNNDNYVVSWDDPTTGDHFRILNSSGNFVTPQIDLPTTFGSTDVTALADGTFVVSYFNLAVGGHFAEIFNPDGTLAVSQFQLSTSSGLQATTALLDGRFMIVYDTAGDIFGRIWNPDGTPGSNEFLVNTNTAGTQNHPHLDTLADGRVVVSWQDSSGQAGDNVYTIFDPRESGVDVGGTASNDEYFGSAFDDTMSGGTGDDTLHGGAGNDLLLGALATISYSAMAALTICGAVPAMISIPSIVPPTGLSKTLAAPTRWWRASTSRCRLISRFWLSTGRL